MNWREGAAPVALLLTLILAAPIASAHSDDFDPLVVELHSFLARESMIVPAPPPAGAVAFPASTPAAPGAALRFTLASPVHFSPGAAFELSLTLRASAPVLPGDGLELSIEPGGAAQRVSLGPALAPDSTTTIAASLPAAAEYAKGAPITLVVRALAPALAEDALSIAVGPTGSTLNMHEMRIPTLADLELQDTPLTMFLLETEAFQPRGEGILVHTFSVRHASVQAPQNTGWSPNGTFLVFRGDEPIVDARTHSAADQATRNMLAHTFFVGSQLVRVHPGVGVVVPVKSAPVAIRCIANCPADFSPVTFREGDPVQAPERASSLIPPPRDTRGIPVSEDAPPEKSIPGPALPALLVGGLMLALATRKRG